MAFSRGILTGVAILFLTAVGTPGTAWAEGPTTTVPQAPPAARMVSSDGERLLTFSGSPIFILGANYEGPADRAWTMWEDGHWDAELVRQDMARARSAGLNTLRVFVQSALATDIQAGRWQKLDTFIDMAWKHGLHVILTLYDYEDPDLARVARVAGQIARRYAGHPAILAYDLKNEPHLSDLLTATYPPGTPPTPLHTPALVQAHGERQARKDIPAFRASEEGQKLVPTRLTDDQAYFYVNAVLIYRDFLAQATQWVRARDFEASIFDFLQSPEAAPWQPLLSALDKALDAWTRPQLEAIRSADPLRPITVGYSDLVLASLPANRQLDFHSIHRYPGASSRGLRLLDGTLQKFRAIFPGQPVFLGEFGFSNASLDPDRTASLEMAVFLQLLAGRTAGGAKWMLNDFPNGFNERENNLGMFRGDGTAKPIVPALAALRDYLDESGALPGDVQLEDDSSLRVTYRYRSADALLFSGRRYESEVLRLRAEAPTHVVLSWSDPGKLRAYSTAPASLDVDAAALVTGRSGATRPVTTTPSPRMSVSLAPGTWTTVDVPGTREALARGLDYDIPGGHFYTQTNGRPPGTHPSGYAVTNEGGIPFWDVYQRLGGPDVLGYPISRRFMLDGLPVQAFQKAVFQWNPQTRQVQFLNTFDLLHDRGMDNWLLVYRQVPQPLDTRPDTGLPWEKVVARHLAFLDQSPPIKVRFLANDDWLLHYGLPVSYRDFGNMYVVRAQRAAFQLWKVDVPWAKKGEVTVANGGDLAKEAGLWPWEAVTPENPPWVGL